MSALSEPRPAVSNPATARPRSRRRRLVRGLVAVLAGIRAVAEAVLARSDAAHHPAPGEVVEVAGERLHVLCSGDGDVTIVLETGLVDPAAMFADGGGHHVHLDEPELVPTTVRNLLRTR